MARRGIAGPSRIPGPDAKVRDASDEVARDPNTSSRPTWDRGAQGYRPPQERVNRRREHAMSARIRDSSYDDHDEQAATLLFDRTLAFLERVTT